MPTYSGSLYATVDPDMQFTVAIDSTGEVYGWGDSSNAALPVPTITNAESVDSFESYALALKTDGTVQSWGSAFGDPQVLPSLSSVRQISAGANHALAVMDDGTMEAWGFMGDGEDGFDGNRTDTVMALASRGMTTILRSDGTVEEYGYIPNPQPAGVTNVTSISTKDGHTLALHDDGTVTAWGQDNLGQSTVPVGLSDVVMVSAGWRHSLALKADGTVVAWGSDSKGESSVPAGLTGVVAISAGYETSSAIQSDGTLVMWGANAYGQTTVPGGFEALIPGEAPQPATGALAATVDVLFSGVGRQDIETDGQLQASVGIDFQGRAYQDWTVSLSLVQVQEIYALTLTGSNNGLSDIELPMESWQATNQAGERRSFVQVVIPEAADIIDAISARSEGELVIRKGYRFSDGTIRLEEIIRASLNEIRYDRGGRAFSITLSGYRDSVPLQSGSRELTGVRSLSLSNGKRRARCDIDLFLQPGMTVNAGGESFTADYINYYVNRSDKFCEVSER